MQTRNVVVIGAGIVGVSTAVWLRRAGCDVTLIDRGQPGMGASYGNACTLAACAMVPVTTPGLIARAPGYLLNPDFPLFLRWSALPGLLPFLLRYLAKANDTDTRKIARALTTLTADSVVQHHDLADNTPAARWIRDSAYGFAYPDRAAFDRDRYIWQLRAEHGFVPEILEDDDVRVCQPNLGKDFRLLALLHDHGTIFNPTDYITALVALLKSMGGSFLQAEATDFTLTADRIAAVETTSGTLPCDHAVVTTGAYSVPLMKKLGLAVPLASERGYHVQYCNATGGPSIPIFIASGKFVAVPMNKGVRTAGVVEFGGLDTDPSPAPLRLLRRQARQAFPWLKADAEEEWLGHRPSTPDSLPLIGQIRNTGIFAAFGHQHIGLTSGPKTGRIIADLIVGNPINHDLTPYDPHRFR